jgi:hypothetical protein
MIIFSISHDYFQVSVIHEPSIFCKTVVEKCQTAKRRITLASLYLGTGHLEEQLVRTNEVMLTCLICTLILLLKEGEKEIISFLYMQNKHVNENYRIVNIETIII